jgi:hypothetical protein
MAQVGRALVSLPFLLRTLEDPSGLAARVQSDLSTLLALPDGVATSPVVAEALVAVAALNTAGGAASFVASGAWQGGVALALAALPELAFALLRVVSGEQQPARAPPPATPVSALSHSAGLLGAVLLFLSR